MKIQKLFCMTYFDTLNFLCIYPLLYTAGICDVTYIGVYNTYLHGKCFLSVLYDDIICLAPTQSTLLFVSSVSHAFATHRPTSHFLQKYIVLCVCFCREHIWHLRCFPLEGQCCECFTSIRLNGTQLDLVCPLKCH